ncbi:MAG: glucose PTS transporter subunit IIA [Solobacterium sp.]|nr:glucose PTS transporter subunit IIA [Solobacterium sp.]
MGKYTQLAESIIKNVGGKDNVGGLRHCVTRLRFNLKDESLADDEAIKNTDGVLTVVKAAGEYMVVIGEHVADVYDEVCSQLGLNVAESGDATQGKSFLNTALNFIGACMGPTLNFLCACGVLKGISVVATMMGLPAESGVALLLNAAADCIFYSLPIILGFNAAKNLGIDSYFGFLLAAALTYPTIQGVDINLFGFNVNATYTSSFLPVVFGLLFAAPIYKWLDKRLPDVVRGFGTPLITLAISFPLTFALIGPFANMIGAGINNATNWLFGISPIIGCTILGFLWQILVMFGIHGMLVVFAFYALLEGNPSIILAVPTGATFGIVGITLAIGLKAINKNLKGQGFSSSLSSIFGVTEPAMYGLIIPRKVLLGVSCLCGGIGGLIAGLFGMKAYVYSGMGVFGLLGLLNPANPQIIPIILMVALPFITGFILTSITFKDDTNAAGNEVKAAPKAGASIQAPISGEIKNITESSDDAFASEALGKGVVIVPSDNKVSAPVSGVVKALFPTKHAVGLLSDEGVEVLIHIGIDTVNLNGKGFEVSVKQDERVKAGDLLVTFDKAVLKEAGYSDEVLMVVTNTADYLDVVPMNTGAVKAGENAVRVIPKENA